MKDILYISAAATLGSCLRVYVGRLFAGDWEFEDFRFRLTSDGRYEPGGALFRDLPANMLGSFIMGLVSSRGGRVGRLAFFHKDHPYQKDDEFHTMISVGFCGSLTTFASWNTQMVTMIDGTNTGMGSQVIVALFGYLLGVILATASFRFGLQVATSFYSRHQNSSDTTSTDNEQLAIEEEEEEEEEEKKLFWLPKIFIIVCAFALLGLFVFAAQVSNIQFYKNMTIMWILAPFGALTRWKLSNWNKAANRFISVGRMSWVPIGTLSANLLGSIISILFTALLYNPNIGTGSGWTEAIFFALISGLAGSLSTVSSMVKEIAFLNDDHMDQMKGQVYACLTCVTASLLGLIIYMPVIRI